MMDRFKPPFTSDFVLMLDADVIAMRAFDELFAISDALAGVMAHGSPFQSDHRAMWASMFDKYGLDEPSFSHEHSGWMSMFDDEHLRRSPPYFNTGVLFGSRAVFENLAEPYFAALDFVRRETDSYFFEQIALTLAVAGSGHPLQPVPLRYNFPNQHEFDVLHPVELAEVRFLHFLRTPIVGRERDFATIDSFRNLLARTDLAGSNERLRQRLSGLRFTESDFDEVARQ